MLGNRWPHKPPLGYRLDKEHPLVQGLVGFYALNENTGTIANDACNQLSLTSLGTGTLWGSGSSGAGLSLVTVGRGVQAVVPATLQSAWPMTLVAGFQVLGPPTSAAVIWEISYQNTNTSPYIVVNLQYNSTTGLLLQWNSGGTLQSLTCSSFTPLAGSTHVVACEITSSSQSIWLDGQIAVTASAALSAPHWTSGSTLCLGSFSGYTSTTPNILANWFGWWDRALQPAENQIVARNPWQIFEPRRLQTYFGQIGSMASPVRQRRIISEVAPPEPIVSAVIYGKQTTFAAATIVRPYMARSEEPVAPPGSALSTVDRLSVTTASSLRSKRILAEAEPHISSPGAVLINRKTVPPIEIGYSIYSNTGLGDPIDYAMPAATLADLTTKTWTSPPLAAPGTWSFGVRAFDVNGREQNLDCALVIVLDPFGNDITDRPSPPTSLRALAMPKGSVRVEWYYPFKRGPTLPTGFHVYVGVGGTPNYAAPLATVAYSSGLFNVFVANVAGLSDGTTYLVGVRAFNASGEEQNTLAVPVTADANGPAAVDSLSATAIV